MFRGLLARIKREREQDQKQDEQDGPEEPKKPKKDAANFPPVVAGWKEVGVRSLQDSSSPASQKSFLSGLCGKTKVDARNSGKSNSNSSTATITTTATTTNSISDTIDSISTTANSGNIFNSNGTIGISNSHLLTNSNSDSKTSSNITKSGNSTTKSNSSNAAAVTTFRSSINNETTTTTNNSSGTTSKNSNTTSCGNILTSTGGNPEDIANNSNTSSSNNATTRSGSDNTTGITSSSSTAIAVGDIPTCSTYSSTSTTSIHSVLQSNVAEKSLAVFSASTPSKPSKRPSLPRVFTPTPDYCSSHNFSPPVGTYHPAALPPSSAGATSYGPAPDLISNLPPAPHHHIPEESFPPLNVDVSVPPPNFLQPDGAEEDDEDASLLLQLPAHDSLSPLERKVERMSTPLCRIPLGRQREVKEERLLGALGKLKAEMVKENPGFAPWLGFQEDKHGFFLRLDRLAFSRPFVGYRGRCDFAVGGDPEDRHLPLVGFPAQPSESPGCAVGPPHRLCSVPERAKETAGVVQEFLRSTGLAAYDPSTESGHWTGVSVRVSSLSPKRGGGVMAVVAYNPRDFGAEEVQNVEESLKAFAAGPGKSVRK